VKVHVRAQVVGVLKMPSGEGIGDGVKGTWEE
jgi:hypothetical protein